MSPPPNKKRRSEGDASIHEDVVANTTSSGTQQKLLLEGAKAAILFSVALPDQQVWHQLSMEWKLDHDVARAALVSQEIEYTDLPIDLKHDRDFLVSAVSENTKLWDSLPDHLRDDIDFFRSLSAYTCSEILEEIFAQFPDLVNERNVWLTVVSDASSDVGCLVASHAPPAITSDSEIMLKACVNYPNRQLFECVDASLAQSRAFLETVLCKKPEVLAHIPRGTLILFPDLAVKFLPSALLGINKIENISSRRSKLCSFADSVDVHMWGDRDFCRAWFQSGGPMLQRGFMNHLENDREVFLWILEHFPKDDADGIVSSFNCAGVSVRGDKAFMLNAIELNPNIYHVATTSVRVNYDVFLIAFGGTPKKYPQVHRGNLRQVCQAISLLGPRVEEELLSYGTFVDTLLRGILQSQCSLSLLNQGVTTSSNYIRLIAAFLEVPTGKRLQMLRQAKDNLSSVALDFAKIYAQKSRE